VLIIYRAKLENEHRALLTLFVREQCNGNKMVTEKTLYEARVHHKSSLKYSFFLAIIYTTRRNNGLFQLQQFQLKQAMMTS